MSRMHGPEPRLGAHRGSAPSPFTGVRHALSIAALCVASGVAWAAPAATVLFTSGEVRAVSAQGTVRELKTGEGVEELLNAIVNEVDPPTGDADAPPRALIFESGETVKTGKGRVQLRMVDGALMALGERTTLRLDDYRLAGPAGTDERGFMSLLGGGLRTISGSIGKPRTDNYKLDTPSGTIGIRGTEYTADVENGLRVGVIGGRVAVCNDGGR